MNTYKAYNKKGRSKQIIALMLVLVLSLGQMAIALANTGSVFDPNTGEVIGGDSGDGGTGMGATPPSTDGDGGFIFDPNASGEGGADGTVLGPDGEVLGDNNGENSTTEYGSGTLGADAYNDPTQLPAPPGVEVFMEIEKTTTDTEWGHQDKVTITGSIQDKGKPGDTDTPAITAGMKLRITFPSYAVVGPDSQIDNWLDKLKGNNYITQGSGMVPGTNTCELTFTGAGVGDMLISEFRIILTIDVTKYTGEDETVKMEFDDNGIIYKYETEGKIVIDDGSLTDYGVSKRLFGDNFESIGGGLYKIKDKAKPVEYTVNLMLPELFEQTKQDKLVITDLMVPDMLLCDKDGFLVGETNPALGRAVTLEDVFIWELPLPAGSYTLTQDTAPNGWNRFTITIEPPYGDTTSPAGEGYFKGGNFRFRYNARLRITGYDNDGQPIYADPSVITNIITVKMTGRETWEEEDRVELLTSESTLLEIYKKVLDRKNAVKDVIEIGIDPVTGELEKVTFEITLRQYMESYRTYPEDFEFATDTLMDCFILDESSYSYSSNNGQSPFKFIYDDTLRSIKIVKSNTGGVSQKIADGTYTMRFTVSVDGDKLKPGERAANTIRSTTVYIYRDAELHITKKWANYGNNPNRGSTITFELRSDNGTTSTPVATVTGTVNATGDTVLVMPIGFLALPDANHTDASPTHTYYLREKLDNPTTDYGEINPIPIVIRKVTQPEGKVTFEATGSSQLLVIDPALAGKASLEVTNEPDDFLGSLEISKKGNDNVLLTGGKFQLTWLEDKDGVAKNEIVKLVLSDASKQEYTPDPNGEATFSVKNGAAKIINLEYGKYEVKELEAPQGYTILTDTWTLYIGKPGQNNAQKHQTLAITNNYFNKGKVTVYKSDTEGKRLEGVGVELYRANYSVDPNTGAIVYETDPEGKYVYGQVTDGGAPGVGHSYRKYTDTSGMVSFNDLPRGKFKIREYIPSGFSGFGGVIEVEFEIDENGAMLVEAAYDSKGNYVSGSLQAKDAQGNLLDPQPINLRLSGNTIGIYLENERVYADLRLLKYDSTASAGNTKLIPLAGVKFKLEKVKVTVDLKPIKPGVVIDPPAPATEWITDSDGYINFEHLEYGYYLLTELEILPGYKARPKGLEQLILIDEDTVKQETVGGVTKNVAVFEWPNPQETGRIRVHKTGENEKGVQVNLQGAYFGLYSREHVGAGVYDYTRIRVAVTGADGIAEFDVDLHKGTYYVKEESAPVGHMIPLDYMPGGVNEYTEVTVGEGDDFTTITLPFANPRETRNIRLVKTLADGAVPSGITFTLSGVDFSGKAYSKSITTGNDGVALFEKVPFSGGNGYTLTETGAKPGYAVIGTITNIVVNKSTAQEIVYSGTETVDAVHRLSVRKLDSAQSQGKLLLQGAEFILQVGTSGNSYVKAEATATPNVFKYVGTQTEAEARANPFVTNADGVFEITHIPAGTYNLYETKAPDGYKRLTAPQKVVIEEFVELKRWDVENASITGAMLLTKKGGKETEPNKQVLLPGITFRIKGPNGYDETFTTDSNGQIRVTGLVYGDYQIVDELNTPAEYIQVVDINRPATYIPFTIDGTVAEVAIDVLNPPKEGRVEIDKVDIGYKPLQGAMFSMKPVADDGTILDFPVLFATSGADGKAVFENIPYGFYAIQEVREPYGSILDPVIRYVSIEGAPVPPGLDINSIIQIGGVYTWVNDSITGSLLIIKTDGDEVNPAYLSGAKFKLYSRGPAGSYGVELALNVLGQYSFMGLVDEASATEIETDANGKAEIVGLPYGVYDLEETAPPDGHTFGQRKTYRVFITDGFERVEQLVENPPVLGRLEVLKVDADPIPPSGAFLPLRGAVVRLYEYAGSVDPDDYDKSRAKAEVTTDQVGRGSIENIPMGEYVAIEEVAPPGYGLGSDADRVKYFELKVDDATYTHQLRYENNKLDYKLKIIKVDKDDNQVVLPGAKFKVVDQSGWGPDPDDLVTDANGEILLSNLPAGTYTVQEIEAPKGYKLDPTKKTVVLGNANAGDGVIDPNDPTLVTYTAENEFVIGKVELLKVDENGKQLEGAEFQLLDENDAVLKLVETGAGTYDVVLPGSTAGAGGNPDVDSFTAGKVTISGLPMGKYTFKEVKAPDNYVILGNGLHAFEITETNYALVKVQVENLPEDKPALAIRKVDSVDRNFSLVGAEFTLYKSTDNGSSYTELVEAKTTGASGVVTFTDLEEGLYQLKETKSPTGYKLPSIAFNFTVAADGKITITSSGTEIQKVGDVYTVTFLNEKEEQQLRFKKVDSSTGVALPGAIFTLTGNGVSETLTAGSDGHTPYVTLTPGTYTLTEIKAPDGYQLLSSSSTIVVMAGGITVDGTALSGTSPFTFTVNNTPRINRILLYKTDSRSSNPLSGAVFSVTPRSGGNGVTLTTNSSGQSNVVTVTPGTYDIVETTAPSGYTRPLSGWVLQVNADGTASVSGTGITSWTSGGVIVVNITNTYNGTTTPTPTPSGGGGGGSSSSGGGGGSTTVSTPAPSQIPLGPGLPQTGELTNTQALMLGASLLLLCLIALLLFVALGGKRENTQILPALM